MNVCGEDTAGLEVTVRWETQSMAMRRKHICIGEIHSETVTSMVTWSVHSTSREIHLKMWINLNYKTYFFFP